MPQPDNPRTNSAARMSPRLAPEGQVRRPRVVVVGAGFAGLAAARSLTRTPVDVVVVDRHNFHTFLPLLYQVATAGLNAADVAYPVRGVFRDARNVAFKLATATGVDFDSKCVQLDGAENLPYDYLVVAAGSETNYFGVPGAEEHAFPLYNLADAVRLRNHVLSRFEAAYNDPSLIDRGALNFVVVGGGPTGVEMAGALVELFHTVLHKEYPGIEGERATVVLVEMLDTLLPPFGKRSRRYAYEALSRRGVRVLLEQSVATVEPECARLGDGNVIPTQTVIWAAGVRGNDFARHLGLELTKQGRIKVGDDLSVPGHADVFVVGDLASAPSYKGRPWPQLAPVAIQAGEHVAGAIAGRLRGSSPRPFRYRDKGIMATIGRRSAVAELASGVKLRGTAAWLAWLLLHLLFLIGFRNRLSVLINWAWSYLAWDRGPRIILEAPPPADTAPPASRRRSASERP